MLLLNFRLSIMSIFVYKLRIDGFCKLIVFIHGSVIWKYSFIDWLFKFVVLQCIWSFFFSYKFGVMATSELLLEVNIISVIGLCLLVSNNYLIFSYTSLRWLSEVFWILNIKSFSLSSFSVIIFSFSYSFLLALIPSSTMVLLLSLFTITS